MAPRIKITRPGYLPTFDAGSFLCVSTPQIQVAFSAEPTQTGNADIVHGGVTRAPFDETQG